MTSHIAQTILHQLGGTHFIFMTGATDITSDEHALSFKLPRNAFNTDHINFVRITLNNDEYDIDFERWNWTTARQISARRVTGVGADRLRETFTDHTGLHLSV